MKRLIGFVVIVLILLAACNSNETVLQQIQQDLHPDFTFKEFTIPDEWEIVRVTEILNKNDDRSEMPAGYVFFFGKIIEVIHEQISDEILHNGFRDIVKHFYDEEEMYGFLTIGRTYEYYYTPLNINGIELEVVEEIIIHDIPIFYRYEDFWHMLNWSFDLKHYHLMIMDKEQSMEIEDVKAIVAGFVEGDE